MKNYFLDKKWLYTFFTCVVCVFPLLSYNLYYNDDYARAVWGYTGWKADGRPVADIVSRLINFSFYGKPFSISDTHPLPLLVGILFLSISASFFCKQYIKDKSPFVYIIFSIVIINGFSLENIVYRFDSLTMIFASATGIVAVAALNFEKNIISILCSVLLLTVSLNTYQSAINLYLTFSILVFLVFCYRDIKSVKIYIFILRSVFSCMLSLFLYYITGYNFINNDHLKNSINNSGISISSILDKSAIYAHAVYNGLSVNDIIIFLPIVVLFFVFLAKILFLQLKEKKLILFCLVFCSPLLMFITIPGVFLIVQHTELSHKAMMSVGGIEFIITICAWFILSHINSVIKYICILPLVINAVSSYAYYNASFSQKEYIDFYIKKISYDIDHISGGNEIKIIYLKGGLPNSPEMNIMGAKYPALSGMALSLNEYSSWILPSVFKKFGLEYSFKSFSEYNMQYNICLTSDFMKRNKYVIYKFKDFVVIDFDKNLCEK